MFIRRILPSKFTYLLLCYPRNLNRLSYNNNRLYYIKPFDTLLDLTLMLSKQLPYLLPIPTNQ